MRTCRPRWAVRDDERQQRVGQAHAADQHEHRNDRHLHRHHHRGEDEHEQQILAAEFESRENVAGHGCAEHLAGRHQDHHQDGVPEVQPDRDLVEHVGEGAEADLAGFGFGTVGVSAVMSVQTTGPSVRKAPTLSTAYLANVPSPRTGVGFATASIDICDLTRRRRNAC